MALLGGTEHERLVDVTEVRGLGLCLLEPRLQLLLGHLKVTNVGGRCQIQSKARSAVIETRSK